MFLYLFVGISEEVYFRGIIPRYLKEEFSTKGIVLWSTLIFGIGHVATAFTGSNVFEIALTVLNAFIFGWLAMEMTIISSNIIPVFLVHFLFDFETKIVVMNGKELLIAEIVRGIMMFIIASGLLLLYISKESVKFEFVEEKRVMNLEDLRIDCAIKQKRGIHFISASIVIWLLVMMVQFLDLPILTKNLLTFCCTAPLLPLAFLMSKLLKIQFQDKSNPLNNLGILFSINQILYLLIAMWIYPTVPEKMLMVIAMIFGAHLLPYSWLYKSKTYMIMSVLIPIASLIVGCNSTRLILALMMLVFEIIFTALLIIENRKI